MTHAPLRHLSLDLTGFMEAAIGASGTSDAHLDELADAGRSAVKDSLRRRESGEIGFWNLPDDRSLAREAMDFARSVPEDIDTVVVLGIGGSSLGPHALYSALARPYEAARSRTTGMPRRVFFPDNPDPHNFSELLATLSLEKTLFNVVTKSGSTAETAAQLLVVADRLEKQLGAAGLAKHLVVTTDPERGALRSVARELGAHSFPVPPSVGGRFSVLSAVGLVPAALAGLDVMGLLDGARAMRDRILDDAADDLRKNPALLLAALLHENDVRRGRPMVVVMPYCDGLYDTADWFRQLWAESLGKARSRSGQPIHVGPTPIASRGATDQHSQLQLYAEGPDDKVYLFLSVADRGPELTIPGGRVARVPEFAYLAGHGMGELLDAELLGTRSSLTLRGRPNGQITLSRQDAPSLGALMMLFEATTAFAGPLYDVDAFDQPGVEEAKRLAYAALGRDGYSDLVGQLEAGKRSDSRYRF